MVGKWMCKNPLTLQERILIKEGLDLNMSYREICDHSKRPKSTIRRECKRLGDVKNYDAYEAQKDFEQKQRRGK